MRQLLLLACILVSELLAAQIYLCKDATIKFTSEAPLELIKAQSSKAKGVIDLAKKEVQFAIDVDSFEGFNSGLQKEHFQENYMETEKYPTATFKGKIIEDVDLSKPGTSTVRAKGIFNIHGTEKERLVKVKINVKEKEILVDTNFEVPLEDHNIKIPKIVNQKIASVIMVEMKALLKPKS